jgi:RNA polymerase sigma-70 factor (ECF subfamily)
MNLTKIPGERADCLAVQRSTRPAAGAGTAPSLTPSIRTDPKDGTATACLDAFEREYHYIVRTLRRFGAPASDAEDLAQEVFLVMWRRWRDYDASRPLRPWLAGIAYRLVYNHRTRRGREVLGGVVDTEDGGRDPESSVTEARTRGAVLRLLAGLPEKQRTVMVLHELDGMPIREVARVVGVPLFTVYSRLRAARIAFAAAVKRAFSESGTADALLDAERPLPALPASSRRRAVERARALLPSLWQPLRAPRSGLPVLASAAALVLVAAGALVLRPPASAPALAMSRAPGEVRPVRAAVPDLPTALGAGLVGYWRFDELAGERARDRSGRGHDCLLRHADPAGSWTEGVLGGALRLDGNGWLECAGVPESRTISVALWMKRGPARRVRALVTRQFASGSEDVFHFGFRDDLLMIQSSLWRVNLNRPLPERDQWIHVAATHGADHLTRLYVDGQLMGQKRDKRASGSVPAEQKDRGDDGHPNPTIIGGGLNQADRERVGERFQGALDELVIYERELSPEEVAALAARVQPRPRS